MENFKYIKNVDGRIGTILVYNQIGGAGGVNGSDFANEMQHLQNICDKIHIRYNSTGGSVMDGYSIYSSVINSKVPTKSFIDGLAASTAGWCALASNEVAISDMGTLMVHGASGKPTEMVDLANGSIAKMLQNRSGMTIEETTELMSKETFYKAFNQKDRDFLIEKNIVDEVYSTGKKVKIKNSDSLEVMANIYNTLINPKNMSELNKVLNISINSDESEQKAAVAAIQKSLSDKELEVTELKNKLKVLEDEKTAKDAAEALTLKNKATEFANARVKDGKLKADQVDSTIANMSKDQATFDFVANLFGVIESTKQAKKIFDPKNVVSGADKNDKENWSWSEWSKKDPKGLNEMQNSTPEKFTELYNAEFRTK